MKKDLEGKTRDSGFAPDEIRIKAIIRTMYETSGLDIKFEGDIYSGTAIRDYENILFEARTKLTIEEMEKMRSPYMPKFKGDIKSRTAVDDYRSVLNSPVNRVAAKFKLWTASYIDWRED